MKKFLSVVLCLCMLLSAVSTLAEVETQYATRGEFVKLLGELAGADETCFNESRFSDVDINSQYGKFVAWASETGIANGVNDAEFMPDTPVTRSQIAAFIKRYMDKNGYKTEGSGETDYIDADMIADYAKDAVLSCKDAEILKADSEGRFNPDETVTKEEAAEAVLKLQDFEEKYIYPSFNDADKKKLSIAMMAMNKSEFAGAELAKWIYYVAFSKGITVSGDSDAILDKIFIGEDSEDEKIPEIIKMIVPGMYSKYSENQKFNKYFKGEPSGEIDVSALEIGDIIIIDKGDEPAKMYMYNGSDFAELLRNGIIILSPEKVLEEKDTFSRFVVLRQILNFSGFVHSQEEKPLELTEAQEAVIETAKAYLLRGDRMQYDDQNMSPYGEYRWQESIKEPEDYTSDERGYINCAGFVRDTFLFGLGYSGIGLYKEVVLREEDDVYRPYYYEFTGNETPEENEAIKKAFLDVLQPGDSLAYRYSQKGKGGHVMLYIGNGNIIHSTGSSYNYKNMKETYEPTVRFMNLEELFTPGTSRYVFEGKSMLAIVRPIVRWDGNLPENTKNRIANMRGILAEKISSHNRCTMVDIGEEMSFTYHLYNTNDYEVTLDVTDVVPAEATYVSGAEKVDGNMLSWKVTLAPGKSEAITYKIKVKDDPSLKDGGYIYSEEGKVGGVSVKCPKVYIANTLSEEEQQKISEAAKELKDADMTDFDKVNAIYKKVMGIDNILPGTSYDDIPEGVFVKDTEWDDGTGLYYQLGRYLLREDGIYPKMVVPSCYGGRSVYVEPYGKRTRLYREEHFMIGDILLERNINGKNLFIYTNEGLLDLNKGTIVENPREYLASLQGLDNYDYYNFILRPSMIIE